MNSVVGVRQRYNHCVVHPGEVGSVGDAIGAVRINQSAPDLPVKFDPVFSGEQEPRVGTHLSDGGEYTARVVDSNWQSGRAFKTNHGWKWQDYRPPDNLTEPYVGSTFDFDWRNKIATTYEAKRPGSLFLPLPGGYAPSPGELTRGSSVRITAIEPGDLVPAKRLVTGKPDPEDLVRQQRMK